MRSHAILALFFLTASFSAIAQRKTKEKLVWSDEFNYSGLPDSSKWSYAVGGQGWGNNELEFYTARRPENARVENGRLIIEARKEVWQERHYTSARLVTKGKGDWKYGRFEIRAKLPRGRGTWPAIWMLASTQPLRWPDDGEIDIMEHVGFDQGRIHGSIHCKKYNHVAHTEKTAITTVADCSDTFHVYGLKWTPDSISIYVDRTTYFTFANEHSGHDAWPFDEPFHILLNVAVGGNWGGAKGVDDSIYPIRMEVDYVRVFANERKN